MSSPPFKVKAVYEYTSPHDDDLHFPNGQIITVTEVEDDDWYVGEYVDASGVKQDGLFPKNFVEKYEPTAPPRPVRTKKKDSEVPAEPIAPLSTKEPVKEPEPEPELEREEEEKAAAPIAAPIPKESAVPSAPKEEIASPPPQAKPVESIPPPTVPKVTSVPKSSNPPADTSDKPSGGSFRDRIAAFNKAAPPPAPFKPGGLGSGSNTFIKKPFVPPPPSKNAYVPPPREPQPQKVYRREEDPEILAKQQEDQEQAQKAGLAPTSGEGDEEEQPKPTSLKERIALLQKQQQEQAARHAEAAAKKEKPKRPAAKKRTESHDTVEEGDGAILEKTKTDDTIGAHSIEAIEEEGNQPRRRKPSRGASYGTPGANPRNSVGDGNEADLSGAGDTEDPEEISTGRDDSDDRPRNRAPPPPARAPSARGSAPTREPDVGEEEGATEEEEVQQSEEEEDDVDPEVRRKEELRARMAKMSGGMGMYGMFGGPAIPTAAPKKKKSSGHEQQARAENDSTPVTNTSAPPVPAMVALPGLSSVRSPEELDKQLKHDEDEESKDNTPITSNRPADVVPDVEDVIPITEKQAPPQAPLHTSGGAPPVPGARPLPPPVPTESRAPPPPPPAAQPPSPGPGSESDDELSERPQTSITSPVETPKPPPRAEAPTSPKSPSSKRASYFTSDSFSPTSPTSNADKRASRLPPPIPGAPQVEQPQTRAPPPPPPDSNVSRASTGDEPAHPPTKIASQQESEGEVTEYEGDYDTDIAPTAPHKDALKAHGKDNNQDDTPSVRSPVLSPSAAPPPLPSAPRVVPPPLPSQPPPPPARQSSDMPRAAPPPPPPGRLPSSYENDDDEYDPYRYNAPRLGLATGGVQQSTRAEQEDDDLYEASPQNERFTQAPPPPPPQGRAAPPPPPREQQSQNRAPPRQSVDVHRPSGPGRRSVELSRMSMDSGFVANDIDLAESTAWWTRPQTVPPVFQGRKDILYEFEESTSTKRGGKTIVTKDLYVLFQDYSQTIVNVQFDSQDPKDAKLEQTHKQPPARLRQDQLEDAHEHFGRVIYEAVVGKKDTIVGDGTPQGLIQELLKPLPNALLPVGTRAYGALVYANLANASTSQNDEIRPGDIITLRNAKFQGKHGPMHAKYSVDVGKPDHVGVVSEWDGTKKKVRAWEQGRESKKTKLESFKLDDLRSGEVKIWRVMPRSWVDWQGEN